MANAPSDRGPPTPDMLATLAPDSTIAPAPRAESGPAAPLPSLAMGVYGEDDAAELTVIRLLGEGGMGRVELARQQSLGREVAVKRVREDRLSAQAIAALLHEARTTGTLEHPNIVPVHAVGRGPGGAPVIVMKRIEGVVWRDLIRQKDHPMWRGYPGDRLTRHLGILEQVCNAVEFAHTRGVIHRDLKPENVMVGHFGEVYVLDWGVALHLEARRARPAHELAGTPAYMAPEMVDGAHPITPRTDVYLLGGMLHEVLAGKPRHRGATMAEVLSAAQRSLPFVYPPSIPEELAALCNRATAANPEDRFASALALREAIAAYREHRGSVELADAATGREAELVKLLSNPLRSPAGLAAIHRLSAECRFGFQQALRVWPDNRVAREGLQRCLVALIHFELDRRNRGAVEALLAELPEPSPALTRRLEQLERALADDERARERLSILQRDQDVEVSALQRVAPASAAQMIGATIFLVLHFRGTLIATRTVAYIAGAVLVFYSLLFIALRRPLSATRLNLNFAIGGWGMLAAILGSTLLALQRDQPVDAFAPHLFLLITAVLWSLALNFRPSRLWLLPAAVPLPSLLIATFWPGHIALDLAIYLYLFSIVQVVLMLINRSPPKAPATGA